MIDPVRFQNALVQSEAEVTRAQAQKDLAQAQVAQRQSEWSMRRQQASRRAHRAGEVITAESRSDYSAQAAQAMAAYPAAEAGYKAAEAGFQAALAGREIARLNLERSIVRAPVEGFVANLNLDPGDCATAGLARLALIDAQSFWAYGYFEETKLPRIHVGEKADVQLLAGNATIKGYVESIADRDNPTGANLLAYVNPRLHLGSAGATCSCAHQA